MSNNMIDEIERNIRQSQQVIECGNAIRRLRNNIDFKTVIMVGYFEKEAIRLVHLKADQNMQSPVIQQSIVLQMDAIGAFSQYLNTTLFKADLADKSLIADQETVEQLAAEELAHG